MGIKKKRFLMKGIYHITVAFLAFVMCYPLIWMLFSSFKETETIFVTASRILPEKFVFHNYGNGWKGFGGIRFTVFFKNSIFVSVLCVLGIVVSSTLVAYGFARIPFRGSRFWFSCMLLSMMIPFQVLMVPQYIMFNQFRWIGTFLPLIVPCFFGNGFGTFLTVQFIKGIPKELDEAAKIDGCSHWGIFRRIIFPLIVPAMVTNGIFAFIGKWDDFMSALLYLNKPGQYTIALALKLFCDPSSSSDWGAMFAMSILSLIPVFLVFVFFQKYLVEGISSTGLKG